jgi:hypothetical protein
MKHAAKLVFLVIVCLLAAAFAIAQQAGPTVPPKGAPLKNLSKQADGHWTPYTPPTYPEGSNVHVVQAGETLWALAHQYLNNPYLWPQLWEKNPYISNPHWIYPGDPVLIEQPKLVEQPAAETPAEPAAEAPAEEAAPVAAIQRRLPQTEPVHRPITLVTKELDTYYSTDVELYGTGRISPTPLRFDTFIVGGEDEGTQRYLTAGEIVFINKGMRQNVYPGQRFQVIREGGEIKNPNTGKFVGYYYHEPGTIKVLIAHDDNAIAQVDFSTREVYIGDALLPFVEKQKLKADKEHKFQRFIGDNGKPTGDIVYVEDSRQLAGNGTVVYLDLGQGVNLVPGQIATVYYVEGKFKHTDEYRSTTSVANFKPTQDPSGKLASEQALKNRDIPRIIKGEVVIIEVFENTAKAKVIEARQLVELGNYVQLQ